MGSGLRVRLGTDEVTFSDGPVRIGSDARDDIVVDDPRVRPAHVVVRESDGAWTAERTGPARTMFAGGQSRKTLTFSVPEVVRLGGKDGPELVLQPIPEGEPDLALHYVAELQKEQQRSRRWLTVLTATVVVLVVLLLFIGGLWGRFEDMRRNFALRDVQAATVKLVAKDADGTTISSGSGTIIRPDGLVLTNAHVAAEGAPGLNLRYGAEYPGPSAARVEVWMVPEGDDFAEHRYTGTPLVADGWLDLALVQIDSHADGEPLSGDLDLPSVDLSDSDMDRGDTVHVVGFPALAAENAQRITTGQVASWQDETRVPGEGQDVIDTTATITGGNSGGAMVDSAGDLIAVPMAVRRDRRDPAMAGLARPVEFADGLRDAAAAGTRYASPYLVLPTGDERAVLRGWAEYRDGECGTPDPGEAPAGVTALCATFGVAGMQPGLDVFFGLRTPEGTSAWRQYDGEGEMQFVVELDDPLHAPIEWRLDVGGGASTLLEGTVGDL